MNSILNHHSEDHKDSTIAAITNAHGYFELLTQTLKWLPYTTIDGIVLRILRAYEANRTIFTFGNGGSASLASHMACDLGKGTSTSGLPRFRVISLVDNIPMITAWANDASYEDIFAEQLRNFVEPDDLVLAISGSGNSPNVLNGLRVAHESRCFTIGLTGFQGGRMREMCDLCLVVPSDNMQMIEDSHVCISHCIFTSVRHRLSMRNNSSIARPTYSSAAD